ncbi:MAG: hypothetical protein O3B21_14215 [Proteobacteria bacterium]|nr:hypothetical protein [Pseudomonadota bacterium]MDA1356257.1 hypothetical protein [Pseudomonadota bacterium]
MRRAHPFLRCGHLKSAAVLLVTVMLAVSACGGKPLHTSKWQDPADEMEPGPGLFSGADGEFTIHAE